MYQGPPESVDDLTDGAVESAVMVIAVVAVSPAPLVAVTSWPPEGTVGLAV